MGGTTGGVQIAVMIRWRCSAENSGSLRGGFTFCLFLRRGRRSCQDRCGLWPGRGVGPGSRVGLRRGSATSGGFCRRRRGSGRRRRVSRGAALRVDPGRVVADGDQQLGGGDHPDPDEIEEAGCCLGDQGLQLGVEEVDLVVEVTDPSRQGPQRGHGGGLVDGAVGSAGGQLRVEGLPSESAVGVADLVRGGHEQAFELDDGLGAGLDRGLHAVGRTRIALVRCRVSAGGVSPVRRVLAARIASNGSVLPWSLRAARFGRITSRTAIPARVRNRTNLLYDEVPSTPDQCDRPERSDEVQQLAVPR